MENLIYYLYSKYISSKDPHSRTLSKRQPIKIYTLSNDQIQFYNSLYIRNILTYSSSSMELSLSLKHLFAYLRLHKFQKIAKENGIENCFKQWVDSEMMPFLFVQTKKQHINSPYIYIDRQPQSLKKQVEKIKQLKSQTVQKVEQKKSKGKGKAKQQKQTKSKQKQIKNDRKKSKQHKEDKSQDKVTPEHKHNYQSLYMVNVLELTNQLQNRILTQQLNIDVTDVKKPQIKKQNIQKYQLIKIQQYINERFGQQALMVFNFIIKYPYIDEKQLLKKTMISSVQLRKCLGTLITFGFINFYPQNSKSILYKSLPLQRVKQIYLDHIAKSILNLFVFLTNYKQNDQQKIGVLLQSISKLDDILMIFML